MNANQTSGYPTVPRLCVRCGRPVSEGIEHMACALRDRR